jgi:D-glycerate 3-kinase
MARSLGSLLKPALVIAAEVVPGIPPAVVENVYLPLCVFWTGRVETALPLPSALVVSLSGLPGTGKSTLVRACSALLERLFQRRVCGFSLDDVYLGKALRSDLARRVHPLLASRGVPGTHDVDLAVATLDKLLEAKPEDFTKLPRFDKLTDDAAPREKWPVFQGRPDLILLDGWFWGTLPGSVESLARPLNAREATQDSDGRFRALVRTALGGRYQELFGRSHLHVHVAAPSHEASVRWRIDQGRNDLVARGHDPAQLDPARIRSFLELFERVGTWPRASRSEVVIQLGDDHLPLRVTPTPDLAAEWERACVVDASSE